MAGEHVQHEQIMPLDHARSREPAAVREAGVPTRSRPGETLPHDTLPRYRQYPALPTRKKLLDLRYPRDSYTISVERQVAGLVSRVCFAEGTAMAGKGGRKGKRRRHVRSSLRGASLIRGLASTTWAARYR